MSASEFARLVVAALTSGVLIAAAVSDIRFRRIPNWTVLAVIALFIAWAAVTKGAGVVPGLEAAGLALVVSVLLYAAKIMGAGDSKLFTAVALFAAGWRDLGLLAVATTLAGGAIALVSFASRPRRALAMFTLRGKGNWGRGVPYGVAIAVGGAVVMWGPIARVAPPFAAPRHVSVQDIRHELTAPEPQASVAAHKP